MSSELKKVNAQTTGSCLNLGQISIELARVNEEGGTLKKTVHIYFFSYFLSLTHTIFKNNKQHEHDTCALCNGACIKVYRLTRRQGGALI